MAPSINLTSLGVCMCFIMVIGNIGIGSATPIMIFNTSTENEIRPFENNIHKVGLTTPIIYGGKTFYSFFITNNGRIAFTNDSKKLHYETVKWSADVRPYIDIPFIAPYYHNGQSLSSLAGYIGHVKYQILTPMGQAAALKDLGQYCRTMVVGSTTFDPQWAMSIKWTDVTSSRIIEDGSSCDGTRNNPCPSNTFQLVILTDGSQSYAILNYEKMDMQPSGFSQAGFNGGFGTGWTSILSPDTLLTKLKESQSSDTVGRYVFRVSSGTIVRGGCSKVQGLDTLSIHPTYAGMFGGEMIDVTGPCFSLNQRIKCRFGDPDPKEPIPPTSDATFINEARVRCSVPRLMTRDRIMLSLSIDNGMTFPYSTIITIVFPGRMPSREHLILNSGGTDLGWFGSDPSTLTLKWQSELLSNNSNDKVDIRIIGYRESNQTGHFSPLALIGSDIPASQGQFDVNPSEHQCTGNDCFDYEVGLIEVTLKGNAIPQRYRYISSKVVPLGWFVKNAMTSQYGSTWPTEMCVNWYNRDKQDMSWLNNLLHCPCSMEQAMADFGRWQPDNSCKIQNKDDPNNCFYHGNAQHCVRAVQPVSGSGNQCCYSQTGTLIYAADTFQGSTPDRSHDWGAAPYGRPGYVPTLSHWLDDVVTFYYCCMWTGYSNSCDYYMDQRPTKDCNGYTPPVPASVFGQGHVATFGGFTYRMIGPGDYVLLKTGNTEVQGRFQKNIYPTTNGLTINNTYTLTAVSVQDKGTSDKVELQIRGPEYNTENQKVNVWVNGKYVHYDDEALLWQDFKGVAVINEKGSKQGKFTVLLTNGVGFQVTEVFGTLQLDTNIPASTFTQVGGLLGGLDGNLTSSNGTDFPDNLHGLSPWQHYNGFQLSWAVTNESLFLTAMPANDTDYGIANPNPTPLPALGSNPNTSFCVDSYTNKQNQQCTFDYSHTGSLEIALGTLAAVYRYETQHMELQQVRSCGLLDVPRSTKTNYDNTLGQTTTITGCRIGSLKGTSTYTCVETSNVTQTWSPAVDAVCQVPMFSNGVVQGNIDSNELDAASGCAASRTFPGVIYSHNNHGDRPRVFAINESNAMVVATLDISPAKNNEWKDIAVGPCSRGDNRSCIYILDDGAYQHTDARTIYKVVEPDVMISKTVAPEQVLVYNWTEHGSDTIMVDDQANVYIIANILGGHGMIVSISSQFWGQSDPIFLDSRAYLSMESTHRDPSGGDISADGKEVLVKTRDEAYYWALADGDITAALIHPGIKVPLEKEHLGESICWAGDGKAYYTLGQGNNKPLYKYTRIG